MNDYIDEFSELFSEFLSEFIRDEESETLLFKLNQGGDRKLPLKISYEEVEEFLETHKEGTGLRGTKIFAEKSYEHFIQLEGERSRRAFSFRMNFGKDFNSRRMEISRTDWTIQIGSASNIFILFLILNSEEPEFRRRILQTPSSNQTALFPNEISRIYTINIKYLGDRGIPEKSFKEIAQSALFNLSYSQGLAITMPEAFDRIPFRLRRGPKEDVQFPRVIYNEELLSYYNLALSSDSLILSYLALYNILEYFFTSVSEAVLHEKMSDIIKHPSFSHSKKNSLRDLSKAVSTFNNKLTELESLNILISENFDPKDMITWVNEFEKSDGPHFSVDTKIFNKSLGSGFITRT